MFVTFCAKFINSQIPTPRMKLARLKSPRKKVVTCTL